MRCGACELHRGQRGRRKQHETKFCHDDLGPRKGKVLSGKRLFTPNASAYRSTASHWAGLWRATKRKCFLFHSRNRLRVFLFIAHSGDGFKSNSGIAANLYMILFRRIYCDQSLIGSD
jgi:hypothetical protein